MTGDFQVIGKNAAALFTLKVHRGEGMALLAMNWKDQKPPKDFVGFAIEYQEPDGDKFFALKNRLSFPGTAGEVNPNKLSTRLSPIQKFRWVHFRNAETPANSSGVTPVFLNDQDETSYGEPQEAAIEPARTYPDLLNVTFTRGFVSSQAFGIGTGAAAIRNSSRQGGSRFDYVPLFPNRRGPGVDGLQARARSSKCWIRPSPTRRLRSAHWFTI